MSSLRPSRMRSQLTTAVVALSAAALLAGCSGGVGGGGAGAASGATIKLGMLAPFTGSEAAFGDYMKFGAQLAVNEVNADGGINGANLELVTEDDACDPTTAVAGANKLVTAGVRGSVGGYCSGSTLPTLPVFKDAGIPMVIAAANSNKLVGQGVFLVNGTGVQQAAAAVAFAKKLSAQSVVLIDDNTDYSVDLADSFKNQADGLNVAKRESVNPDDKDFAATVNSVLGAKPDFIYWTGYYQAGGLLANQLRAAGYTDTFLVGDGAVDAQLAKIAGPEGAKNMFGTFTRTPDMLEGGDEWVAAYKKVAGGADPGPYAMQAYEAVKVMAQAMKDAASTDYDKVIAALHGLADLPLLSGDFTFAEDGSRVGGGFVIVSPTGPGGAFVLADDLS